MAQSAPLSLKSAVKQIKQSYDFAVDMGIASPYFFVTGAGISVPQVPLAQEIINDCKKRSGAEETPSSGSTILDEYSRCLDEAFPAPFQRQHYFQNLIRGKPIPAANFRLAHLLLGERGRPPLARLVVTTNFDDFLSRALQLFGKEHVMCDSPSTVPRLRLSNADDRLQIVYVHGTYYFYDIKNLRGEVEETAASSEYTTATMGSLLNAVLHDQSPIVVGYGGWEGDVFMTSLARRLRGGMLPQPLYWCCYRRNEWQSLPEWLKTHSSVRFVEPEESRSTAGASVTPPAQMPTSGAIVSATADLLGQDHEPETFLDAQSVFDALIQSLDLKPPELTQNPIEFFADQLSRSLPRDGATQGTDLYRIKSTVEELRAAAKWILEYRQQRTVTEQQLHSVREQLRGAKYVDAMPLVLGIDMEELNEQERDDLWEMMWEIINSGEFGERPSDETLAMLDRFNRIAALLPDRENTSERVVKGLSLRVLHLLLLDRVDESATSLLDLVERSQQTDDPAIRLSVGELLYKFGVSCFENPQVAVGYFRLLLSIIGESQDERLRDLLAKGMLGVGIASLAVGSKEEAVEALETFLSDVSVGTSTLKPEFIAQAAVLHGAALGDLGRWEDAVAAYDEVMRRFSETTEPGIREQVAKALVNKGISQARLTPPVDPVATYDEVVRRFGEATEPEIREQVAIALLNKGISQARLIPPVDPVASYDEVVGRFSEATEPGIREQVAKALLNKGVTLAGRGEHDDELNTYNEIVRRFGEASEPGIREQVAKALVNKGVSLGGRGRHDDELNAYNEVVERFGEATEPAIREQVARALVNKGIAQGSQTPPLDPVPTYDEFFRRFGEATEPEIREMVAIALVNKGVMLGARGQRDEEMNLYDEVVRRFGEATEPGIREMVARAQVNKGVILDERGQRDEKFKLYDEIVERFGDATEPGIREQVGYALNSIAFDLLCDAKATWNREGQERAIEGLRQAAEGAERALQYLPSNPMVLGNKGYALFLAGETEAGGAALREAIKLGGEDMRRAELADAEINPVPLDEKFKELVQSMPAPS